MKYSVVGCTVLLKYLQLGPRLSFMYKVVSNSLGELNGFTIYILNGKYSISFILDLLRFLFLHPSFMDDPVFLIMSFFKKHFF